MHFIVRRHMNTEEIAKCNAVNRTASLVTSKGVERHTEFNDEFVSETPLPIRPDHEVTAELQGRRFGSLVVVGLADGHKSKLVCRCDCGRYCLRKTSKMRKRNSDSHCQCGECNFTEHLRDKDEYRRTGRWSVR